MPLLAAPAIVLREDRWNECEVSEACALLEWAVLMRKALEY